MLPREYKVLAIKELLQAYRLHEYSLANSRICKKLEIHVENWQNKSLVKISELTVYKKIPTYLSQDWNARLVKDNLGLWKDSKTLMSPIFRAIKNSRLVKKNCPIMQAWKLSNMRWLCNAINRLQGYKNNFHALLSSTIFVTLIFIAS